MSLVAGVQGVIQGKNAEHLLVGDGGITLQVAVPAPDLARVGKEGEGVSLFTHLIVREDDLQLYGFLDEQGRTLFEMLIAVNGVGPRVALGLLSVLTPPDLAASIAAGDEVALAKAPGVGRQTAKRVIVDLQRRVEIMSSAGLITETRVPASSDPALSFLVSMGFAASEARQALSVEEGADLSVDERVKRALQRMGQSP